MSNQAPLSGHGRSISTATDLSIASQSTAVQNVSIPPSPTASSSSTIGEDADLLNTKHSKDFDDAASDSDSSEYHVPLSAIADAPSQIDVEEAKRKKKEVASWSELPRKWQLALLTISRLSEPLTQTSLQSYMWYMLKSFDQSLPDSAISQQVGLMQAAFTATQFLTAIAWGRAADSERIGRKAVLMIGLLGTMVSALGFGFSRSFVTAMMFRSLGGALNGNVGVMRTMISEIIKEKKYQSRAFMVLPMTFNVGVIIGPILGGLLSDPIGQYPGVFGPGSWLGGEQGIWWLQRWPYALPNIVSAIFLVISTIAVFLGLEETHEALRHRPDKGRALGNWIKARILRRWNRPDSQGYSAIPIAMVETDTPEGMELQNIKKQAQSEPKRVVKRKLSFKRIWTRNVIITLTAHGLMAMHVGTFNNAWFMFLSTTRFDAKHPSPPTATTQRPPIYFTGGLAMPPATIGLALSILGMIGIFTQLFLYPYISARLGTERAYKLFLSLFPIAYILAPYLSLLPSSSKPPAEASGVFVWAGITVVLAIQVLARTFALPGMTILVNNSCPHPSVLGTLHGIAQSISSGMRTIGPAVAGWLYGRGLKVGIVGSAFWGLACVAIIGFVAGSFVKEGSGHEIVLEGEEEDEALMSARK